MAHDSIMLSTLRWVATNDAGSVTMFESITELVEQVSLWDLTINSVCRYREIANKVERKSLIDKIVSSNPYASPVLEVELEEIETFLNDVKRGN